MTLNLKNICKFNEELNSFTVAKGTLIEIEVSYTVERNLVRRANTMKSIIYLGLVVLFVSACNLGAQIVEVATIATATSISATHTSTLTATVSATNTPLPSSTPVTIRQSGNPAPVVSNCTPRRDWLTYTVQRGDTLFNIAQRANSTVSELSTANCISDPSSLRTGQTLYVPREVRSNGSVVYWVQTQTRNANSIIVACDAILSPIESSTARVADAATNIRNSLNLLFSSNQGSYNHWAGQGLSVQSVSIDSNGRANIAITGNVMLVGSCADGVMKAQILQSIFAEPSVQTAYVTVGGRNLVQIFDMSGLQPANAVFTRADIPIVTNPQPTSSTPVSTCRPRTDWLTYTVQRGDTLFNIAQRANSTVNELVTANCLTDPTNISVGQTLYVPNAIASNVNVVYWVETASRQTGSVTVACGSIISPVASSIPRGTDAAANISSSLSLLFTVTGGTNNYWAGQGLGVQNVAIDSNGRANIAITGNVTLVGSCADGVMKAQILQSVFAEPSVQSAYITVGGQNLVQIFDASGLEPADAVFTRADIPIVQ